MHRSLAVIFLLPFSFFHSHPPCEEIVNRNAPSGFLSEAAIGLLKPRQRFRGGEVPTASGFHPSKDMLATHDLRKMKVK